MFVVIELGMTCLCENSSRSLPERIDKIVGAERVGGGISPLYQR